MTPQGRASLRGNAPRPVSALRLHPPPDASVAPSPADASPADAASPAPESVAFDDAASDAASCAPLSDTVVEADASADGGATALSSPLQAATHANDAKVSG